MSDINDIAPPQPENAKRMVKSAFVGYIASFIMVVAAYYAVHMQLMSQDGLFLTIAALALVQLFIQIFAFLRIHADTDGTWNVVVLIFTTIVIALLVAGSLWIMYNLNYNMVH